MKDIVQLLILLTFVISIISSFVLDSSTGLVKDMRDIKTSTLTQFVNENTSLSTP